VDPIGYTHSAQGITRVAAHARKLEGARLRAVAARLGLKPSAAFLGAISPHDDYQYAQQVYLHVYPYLRARHVILVGVAHKARRFPETWGKLVFDGYDAWHGPHGQVPISPLRRALLSRLAKPDRLVHDRLQALEHSVEGLVPWLQHFNRSVQIVSILVPYMTWARLDGLAARTGAALARIMKARGWQLGRDVAILISSDSVHYGDQGWGGKTFADFGVDRAGYNKAVARDLDLVSKHLTGPIALSRLSGLFHRLVRKNVHAYRITWCGRFSVPFGVALLARTAAALGRPVPQGVLLRYGTTLDPGRSDPGVPGLGVTAPASLRHWVGFAAVGYRYSPFRPSRMSGARKTTPTPPLPSRR
jgi:AmmeMemoRadiSam system protein B